MSRLRQYDWRKILGALLALVAVSAISIVVTQNGATVEVKRVPAKTVAEPPPEYIAVDGKDKDAKPDDPVKLSDHAQEMTQTLSEGAAKGTNDLVAKEPGAKPLSGPVAGPVAKLSPPFASDSVPGCRTRTLTTNWSYRRPGTQVRTFDLHYTAGPDVPNSRSEVDGLTAFGNKPSARVSWQLNIDKDGNCDYNVPYRYKAWTIGNLNDEGINAEIAGRGDAPYMRPAGYRELAKIYLDIHRSYPAITLQRAVYKDCHVVKPGIGTHWMGGPCSGGHVDIKPLNLDAVIRQLRLYVGKELDSRLRRSHAGVHKALRDHRCAPEKRSRSVNCKHYYALNHSLHARARARKVGL